MTRYSVSVEARDGINYFVEASSPQEALRRYQEGDTLGFKDYCGDTIPLTVTDETTQEQWDVAELLEKETLTAVTVGDPLDIETYIKAAQQHGEDDEPDHEVGDLQDILRVAWEIMTPDQRERFAKDDAALAVLYAGGMSDQDPEES